MATVQSGTEFKVFKFRETGLAALCIEVAYLITTGEIEQFNVDLNSAEYREDHDGLCVVFKYKQVPCEKCGGA